MTTKLNAMNARESARPEASQGEPDPAASLGKDENSIESRTEEQPIPRRALDRNILAVSQLLERYPAKLAKAAARHEPGDVVSLEKEMQNLVARKAALEKLRDQEARKNS